MKHAFTDAIMLILEKDFSKSAKDIYDKSLILQYINLKTRSANKGSKSRGSFANLYAIYVLVEDYLNNGFDKKGKYSDYEGARFTDLFKRQRELPFGSKLQNHALNHRMNEEFKKFFPTCEFTPIIRDVENNRYWFNEQLLKVTIGTKEFNIANTIITLVNGYVKNKRDAFESFIQTCEEMRSIAKGNADQVKKFISDLLAPNVDARLFEIVSYAILKNYYHDTNVYFGFELDKLVKENLKLYKTGRTNANDGGIDFVMKPLGRFFQVTETLDIKKYFLDIEKIERFPITFVIKSEEKTEKLHKLLEADANRRYPVKKIVDKLLGCIEEIINIPTLNERFKTTIAAGYLSSVLDEIILQSKVEFNYEEEDEIEEAIEELLEEDER